MIIKNLRTPDDIDEIKCLECGAMSFGTELKQEDIDLLKELRTCLMCNTETKALKILLTTDGMDAVFGDDAVKCDL